MKADEFYFVFDVESIGLHGEGYAVGGGLYNGHGVAAFEFLHACDPEKAQGTLKNRQWVRENCPPLPIDSAHPKEVRARFWQEYRRALDYVKTLGFGRHFVGVFGECIWPVEAGFFRACIEAQPEKREFAGPYPFHDVASVMLAAGLDPMATYERTSDELPKHNPLSDARQSMHLLLAALGRLDDIRAAGRRNMTAMTLAAHLRGGVKQLQVARDALAYYSGADFLTTEQQARANEAEHSILNAAGPMTEASIQSELVLRGHVAHLLEALRGTYERQSDAVKQAMEILETSVVWE